MAESTGPLSRVVGLLQTELIAVREREREAQLALSQHQGERKKLEKMIELATARPQKKAPPITRAARGQAEGIAPETVQKVLDRIGRGGFTPIEEMPEGAFTVSMLYDIDLHESSVERGLRRLRDTGRVRLVGQKKLAGTRPSNVYVLVNAQDEDRRLALVGSDSRS